MDGAAAAGSAITAREHEVWARVAAHLPNREIADEWIRRFPSDATVMAYIGRSGWNTLRVGGEIPDDEVLEAVDTSYDTVVSKLPKRERPGG